MFSNKSTTDVTQQILICQNIINDLNLSSDEKRDSIDDENLTVDIVSNGYKYESSSVDFNTIEPCSVISIISPYAFTIQLIRDRNSSDEFFKHMKLKVFFFLFCSSSSIE